MQVRLLRLLREKHSISISQLARLSSVCRQRMVQIELGNQEPTEYTKSLVKSAFEKVIKQRQRDLVSLENDFLRHRHNLLDYIEEEEIP